MGNLILMGNHGLYRNGATFGQSLLLDNLSSQAAYSLRRLRTAYTGNAIRVRRSSDNLETDIGFASAPQTRTNLAAVPINNNSGNSATGVAITTIRSGTEFGLPYVDVQWQGTATAAGFAQFIHSTTSAFNPTIHAPVTAGLIYTCSISYRLVAGSLPTGEGGWAIRGLCRINNGSLATPNSIGQNTIPTPTTSIQRVSLTGVASPNTAYIQPNIFVAIALNEVVDFTMRFYSANVVQGVGNAKPMLLRNTPEVIANIGDLDVESLLAFNGINNFTFSESFENVVWTLLGATVTPNTTIAPNNTLTADTIVEDTGTAQHRFARTTVSFTAGDVQTLSVYVKRGVGSRQFQLGLSGTGLVARAYFNLTTGTLGDVSNCTASITPLPNDWYRVSLTATIVTTGAHTAFLAMANNTISSSETYTGDGTSSIILWGAQLNQGTLISYCPTGASVMTGTGNVFVTTWYDQGRYWNASRKNLVTYSEEIDNTAWRKLGAGVASAPIVTANAGLAPNGTLTADRVQFALNGGTTSGDQSAIDQTAARTITGQPYVYSFWARTFDASTRTIQLSANGATSINCTVTPTWQRFSLVYPSALDTVRNITIRLRGTFGTSDSADLLIWGIQQEQSTVLTEYQPILAGTPLNAIQTTAGNQPTIVTLGAVVSESGKPSVLNTTTAFMQNDFGAYNQPFTRSYVITREDNVAFGSNAHYISNFNSSPNTTEYGVTATTMNMYSGGTPHAQTLHNFVLGETGIFTSVYNNAVGNALTKNGNRLVAPANVASASNGLNGVRIGGNVPSGGTTGQFAISELIIFTLVLTISEIQTLQRNQGQFFGITVS